MYSAASVRPWSCGVCHQALPWAGQVGLHVCPRRPEWSLGTMEAAGLLVTDAKEKRRCRLCQRAVGVKRSHQCQSQALHTFMLDQSATQAGDTDSARPDEAHLATIREGHGLVLCVVPEECITRSCGVAAFTGVHCTMVLISSSPVDPDGRGGYTAMDLQVNQLVCAYTGVRCQAWHAGLCMGVWTLYVNAFFVSLVSVLMVAVRVICKTTSEHY